MRNLVIAGAGGFGRELAAYARVAGFEVVGFLDDDPDALQRLDGADREAGIVSSVDGYSPRDGELVAVGVGHPRTRLKLASTLRDRGASLGTVIHPTALVAPTASLGEGVVLAPFTCVGPAAQVGAVAMLNYYSSVGHDGEVGAGCVLAPYAAATGFTVLEEAAFLSSHAVVTPGKRVGAGARVSAGAVVFHDIPPGSLAAGNPARARLVPEDL